MTSGEQGGLRVLLVHSRYSSAQSSGENIVVDRQGAALERAGYSVELAEEQTDVRERAPLYRLEAAATVATGLGRTPRGKIANFRPDVVHVHNLFPNYGRTWVPKTETPVVATLHNFRPLCPAATLYRDGHRCTDCMDAGNARPAVQYACYRGSRVQTVPLAIGTRFDRDPVLRGADRLIALSAGMRDHYVTAGVDADKIHVLPGFVPRNEEGRPGDGGDYWLFVGRLTREKGLLDLLEAWPGNRHRLVVIGSPERHDVLPHWPAGVEYLGERPREAVQALMAGARGLLFPSKWDEGLALVCLEALAGGTPVLAWGETPGARAIAELGVGGTTTALSRAELTATLDQAAVDFPSLRARAREVFDERFSESSWVAAVREVYDAAGVSTSPR